MSQLIMEKKIFRPRLVTIDMLRGIACLLVLFYHAVGDQLLIMHGRAPLLFWAAHPITFGYVGVNLFLVISGFCIHQKLASSPGEGRMQINFGKFWFRRFRRLYPPYLIMLGICSIFIIALMVRRQHHGLPPEVTWKAFVADLSVHLLLIHLCFQQFRMGMMDGPMWTLSLEEFLYLLYFPLLWVRNRVGPIGMVICVAIVSMSVRTTQAYLSGELTGVRHLSERVDLSGILPLFRWIEWALGALAVEYCYGRVHLPRWFTSISMAMAAFAAAIGVSHLTGFTWLREAMWSLAFCVLICRWGKAEVTAQENGGHIRSSRGIKILAGVGLFSYSLYLVHVPVLGLLQTMLDHFIHSRDLFAVSGVRLLAAVLCLPVAYGFFMLFEKPFMSSSRKKSVQQKAETVVVA